MSSIISVIVFLFFIWFTLKVTWTILKFFAALIGYGIIFVLVVSVFGFATLAPVLFVAGVVWLLVKCIGIIL